MLYSFNLESTGHQKKKKTFLKNDLLFAHYLNERPSQYPELQKTPTDLLLNQRHDPYTCKDRLPAKPLPWNAVSKCFRTVGHWLTEVPHEERHIRPAKESKENNSLLRFLYRLSFSKHMCLWVMNFVLEFFLALAAEVSHEPLAGEGILSWHPPPHHSIQEGLPLTHIKAQHLTNKQTKEHRATLVPF